MIKSVFNLQPYPHSPAPWVILVTSSAILSQVLRSTPMSFSRASVFFIWKTMEKPLEHESIEWFERFFWSSYHVSLSHVEGTEPDEHLLVDLVLQLADVHPHRVQLLSLVAKRPLQVQPLLHLMRKQCWNRESELITEPYSKAILITQLARILFVMLHIHINIHCVIFLCLYGVYG